jgi:hypothetical protein
MDKLFVSDEIAIKLKEKGFIEPCMKGVKDGHRFTTCGFGLTNQGNTHDFTIPLHQQVIDWFREKHNIQINSGLYPKQIREKMPHIITGRYNFYLYIEDNNPTISNNGNFSDDYYVALSKTIEEALNLI